MIERPDWNGAAPAAPVEPHYSGGKIVRSDWSEQPADDDPDKALVDAGVFTNDELAAIYAGKPQQQTGAGLDKDMLARWEQEGSVEHNRAKAQEAASRILSGVDDATAFAAGFDKLPGSIQDKVFDVLRLEPSRSPEAAVRLLDQIEASLTPQELSIAETWLRGLTAGQRQAIMKGLGRS